MDGCTDQVKLTSTCSTRKKKIQIVCFDYRGTSRHQNMWHRARMLYDDFRFHASLKGLHVHLTDQKNPHRVNLDFCIFPKSVDFTCGPPSSWVLPTFLSRVDGGHGAERTLSHVVVDPDLDLVRGKRRDALVLEDVSGGVGRRDGGLHPTRSPKWAEGHHVAEARAALQLLGNRLRREERGGGVTQSGWLNTILKILIPERNVVVRRLAMWERQWGLLLLKRNYRSKLDGCKYQTAQNSELIRASGGSPSIINYVRVLMSWSVRQVLFHTLLPQV